MTQVSLDRGVFLLSLDFELIWGTLDLFGPEGFRRACLAERELVPRLLGLLARYRVSATWCIVGHLFLDRCPKDAHPRHPEIVRPRHAWKRGDWFAEDPGGDEASQPLFFGRGLVRQIHDCPVAQEIGSHSFSHVIFGDPGCSRECADSELRASVLAARELGIKLRSFAFPRNSVGHLDVLRDHSFASFRGPGPRWYEQEEPPGPLARLARLVDVLLAKQPPALLPRFAGEGLWDLPGSMIYHPMHGLRRYIPLGLRVKRASKGLRAAANEKKLFHLWFHPTNLADESETMFEGLEKILFEVSALRDQGRLETLTMGALAARLEAPGPSA
jgi:peptidoglycan/xylan/chitin deacetylase (PgdA/CDA1 family)